MPDDRLIGGDLALSIIVALILLGLFFLLAGCVAPVSPAGALLAL